MDNPAYYRPLEKLESETQNLFQRYCHLSAEQALPHVREIRERLWKACPYPCIGLNKFLETSITCQPDYATILARAKAGARILDMGCCVGQDLRRLAADGAPTDNLIGTDLEPAFLDLGHDLFLDRDTFKGRMVPCDLLNDQDTRLDELNGTCDAIVINAVFHLFDLPQQKIVARRVIRLMATQPGTMVIGRQGAFMSPIDAQFGGRTLHWHDPQSWKDMWNEVAKETTDASGKEVKLEIEADLQESQNLVHWATGAVPRPQDARLMNFSIRRV